MSNKKLKHKKAAAGGEAEAGATEVEATPFHEPPTGAGFRTEPEMDVTILAPVIVYGEDAAPGDVITCYGNEAHILVGQGHAEFVPVPPPAPPA